VSTAIASDLTLPVVGGHRHFLIRRLHSLTGILFGGYIIVHLLVNATLFQGTNPDVYQEQVNKIHSLPFLLAIEWTFIFLPIIFHTVYGIWITFTGQPNVGNYGYAKNWFYFWQRVSAMVIVAFIIFHVLGMKGFFGSALAFSDTHATATTIRHITAHWTIAYLVYPLGILASSYHLANGFWTAAITWGLTISAAAQRRWGFVCTALFALTFGCGMLALFAVIRHGSIVVHG
jgi:succinate dehydrogenase / fumarate reductase cytochrome b subunit